MKVDPMLYESKFFHFLDWVISQYGLYLFMAFVYLCPFIIWWVHRWAKKHPEANVRPNILIYWIFPPRKSCHCHLWPEGNALKAQPLRK